MLVFVAKYSPSMQMRYWQGEYPLRGQAKAALNPFKSEFTIVIFIHYKSKIAVAILDL